ncbi:MAG: AAA family ATPase [bacterium]|nr:AAA family ATPase [bacterium]
MYLKKLEIHGFKSFAKKTALEFEPGITSVVGPNGSGKSNIADSLRWVFGEQSLKLLRGKKTEDVIFAGSDQKARLGGAEVLVSFDNSNRVIPIDYSEVVIGRRLFRNGNSEYLINDNQVRLLDIQDLLLKSGVGNTSYCVIGQGMIDNFILGGPQAIKELIEDASGVKPYYVKRERALRKFDHTESNLTQAGALIAEIEPRLKSLRRQTRKLEQREDLERELREMQTAYFSEIFRGLQKQTSELDAKIGIFDKQIDELEKEILALSEDIEKEEKTRENKSSAVVLQSELEELRKTKQRLLEEQSFLRGKLKVEELKNLPEPKINWVLVRDKFRAVLEKFRAFAKNFSKYRDEPESWRSESDEMENELKQLLEEIDTRSSEHKERQGFEQGKKRLEELNNEVDKISTLIAAAEEKVRSFIEQAEQKKNQLFVKERLFRNKQETLLKIRDQKNSLSIEQAKLQTRKENYENEALAALGRDYTQVVSSYALAVPEGVLDRIARLKKQLEIIGGVDDLVLQEYKETESRFQYLTSQTEDLEKAIADLRTVIAELDESIKKEFDNAYNKISEKFSEYFRVLFGGGKATMTILREKPELSEEIETEESAPSLNPSPRAGEGRVRGAEIVGIEIRATPPGKKLAGIAALSGGERALTSIALLSAILATFPSPFVVLDEVDAALDEANSIRFAKILGTLASKTQFITITHNRETMRQSHTLYGVTMGEDGVSRVLSLKLEQAAAYSSKN